MKRFGFTAIALTFLLAPVGAQSGEPRLTVADVEKVSGLTGIQLVAPGSEPPFVSATTIVGHDDAQHHEEGRRP